MTRRLIGVGVGPGDPELVTVKAVRVLREADVVLVPVLAAADPEPGRAETIVRAYVGADRIRRLEFALNDTGGVTPRRAAAWQAAAAAVAEQFAAGAATVAFGTLRDRLHSAGRLDTAIIGARLGLRDELIAPAGDFLRLPERPAPPHLPHMDIPDIPYLSPLIVPARRAAGIGAGLTAPHPNHDDVTSSWSEPSRRHIVVVAAACRAMLV